MREPHGIAEEQAVRRSIRHRNDIQVRIAKLPEEVGGAALVRRDWLVWILLDADGPAVERRAILAHELGHLARGSAPFEDPPDTLADIRRPGGAAGRRAVARRLVPTEPLRAFVAQRSSLGEPVTAGCVAEAFEVPLWVARIAFEMVA